MILLSCQVPPEPDVTSHLHPSHAAVTPGGPRSSAPWWAVEKCCLHLFIQCKVLILPMQIHTSTHKANCWSFLLRWKWYSIYVSGTVLFWLLAVATDDFNRRAAFSAAWHKVPQRIRPRLRQRGEQMLVWKIKVLNRQIDTKATQLTRYLEGVEPLGPSCWKQFGDSMSRSHWTSRSHCPARIIHSCWQPAGDHSSPLPSPSSQSIDPEKTHVLLVPCFNTRGMTHYRNIQQSISFSCRQ